MHLSRFLFFSIAAALCHSQYGFADDGVQTELIALLTAPPTATELGVCALPGSMTPLPRLMDPQARTLTVPAGPTGDIVRISAEHQQKEGSLSHFRGNVEILYHQMRLTADEVDYDDETGLVTARGHVHYEQKARDENVYAESGTYNLQTDIGHFLTTHATMGARVTSKKVALTSTNPFFFDSPVVDRTADGIYLLQKGSVTSCKVPDPMWTFQGRDAVVRPEDVFKIRNAWLRIHGWPVFFTPYFRHTLKRMPRDSGFLTPHFGTSSVKGFFFGEEYYWAINRSMDLTAGAEVYTARGWAQRGEYRWRGNGNAYLYASYYGVVDQGQVVNGVRGPSEGGETFTIQGAVDLGHGFRAVANVNYLSSYEFRQAWSQNYNEAINSEVHSTGFVTNHFSDYDFHVAIFRYQDFLSITPGDAIEIRSLPSIQFSGRDRPIFQDLPLYFSFDTATDFLNRTQPGLTTPSFVGRFDFFPEVTMPLHWAGWNLVPSLGFRATAYTSSLQTTAESTMESATQSIIGTDRVRTAEVFDLDIRPPVLEKIFKSPFNSMGDKWKHTIEPKITFRYVTGIENEPAYILFDERDIMVNTTQLEYGVTQRIFSKRNSNGDVKEILSWEVKQAYYFDPTFGGALIPGQRNVFDSTIDFSPYAFLDQARHFSPINSTIRLYPSHRFSVESVLDYDTERHRFIAGSLKGTFREKKLFASVGHEFIYTAPDLAPNANQLQTTIGYGSSNSLGPNLVWLAIPDLHNGFLQYSAVQASYNLDCCGVTAEWRRYALGPARNENQWRVAISFANVGTFGNIKKNERLF